MLYLAPRNRATLPKGVALEPLLRVVELGMDVCALRAGAKRVAAVNIRRTDGHELDAGVHPLEPGDDAVG